MIIPANTRERQETIKTSSPIAHSPADCIVVGGIAMDTTCNISETSDKLVPTSYPGDIKKSLGGVAYNVAKASILNGKRLNVTTKLVSSVNEKDYNEFLQEIDDEFSSQFGGKATFEKSGMMISSSHTSGKYISMHDVKGDLIVACANMDAIENMDSETVYDQVKQSKPKCVLFDGNIGKEQQLATIRAARECQALVGFEPTSVVKCSRVADYPFHDPTRILKSVIPNNSIDFATPNVHELTALHKTLSENEYFDTDGWFVVVDALSLGTVFRTRMEKFAKQIPNLTDLILTEGIFQKAIQTLPYIPVLLVKLGSKGVLLFELLTGEDSIKAQQMESREISQVSTAQGIVEEYFISPNNPGIGLLAQYFPPVNTNPDSILSVTGAGDTFCGVVISETAQLPNWFYMPKERVRVMKRAQKAASLTIQSHKSVSEKILEL